MNKNIILNVALLTTLCISTVIQANDNAINTKAIIDSLDLGNPVPANSGKKGVLANLKDHKGDNFNTEQFNKAFREGASSANEVGLPLANGSELKTLASYNETNVNGAQGAWQFSIYGWVIDPFDGSGKAYQAPGAMANYGNRFEYVFFLPSIEKRYVDRVDAKLVKAKKYLDKSGKNVIVTYPRTNDGQFSVHAAFSYDDKTSTSTLKKHTEQLLLNSRSLFNDYLVESKKVENEYLKELRKSSPANLSKEDFYQMLTDFSGYNAGQWDKPNTETQDGFTSFTWSKIPLNVWNFKTSMAWGSVVYPNESLSAEQLASLSDSWKEWGAKKIGKGATSVEVKQMKSGEYNTLVLTLTYPLDGTLQGSKIEDLYMDFLNKGLPAAEKEYEKLEKKALK